MKKGFLLPLKCQNNLFLQFIVFVVEPIISEVCPSLWLFKTTKAILNQQSHKGTAKRNIFWIRSMFPNGKKKNLKKKLKLDLSLGGLRNGFFQNLGVQSQNFRSHSKGNKSVWPRVEYSSPVFWFHQASCFIWGVGRGLHLILPTLKCQHNLHSVYTEW